MLADIDAFLLVVAGIVTLVFLYVALAWKTFTGAFD